MDEQNRTGETHEALRRAMALNNEGLTLARAKRFEEALPCFEEALSLFKTVNEPIRVAEQWGNLGSVYRDLERHGEALESYSEAIRDFTRAIERKPDYSEAYRHRAMAYQLDGKLDLALKDIDDALKITPSNLDLQHLREDLLQEQ